MCCLRPSAECRERCLQEDVKLLIRAASSGSSGLQQPFFELFKTGSWETLMTFTRESARKSPPFTTFVLSQSTDVLSFSHLLLLYKKPANNPRAKLSMLIWMNCRKISAIRLQLWRRRTLRQRRQELAVPARLRMSAFVLIAPSRTVTEGQTVKCVCCH